MAGLLPGVPRGMGGGEKALTYAFNCGASGSFGSGGTGGLTGCGTVIIGTGTYIGIGPLLAARTDCAPGGSGVCCCPNAGGGGTTLAVSPRRGRSGSRGGALLASWVFASGGGGNSPEPAAAGPLACKRLSLGVNRAGFKSGSFLRSGAVGSLTISVGRAAGSSTDLPGG